MATWIGSTGERHCGYCGDLIPEKAPVALLCGSAAMPRCAACARKLGIPVDHAAVAEWNLERELREQRERIEREAQASAPESLLRGASPATPVRSFASMADIAPSLFEDDY